MRRIVSRSFHIAATVLCSAALAPVPRAAAGDPEGAPEIARVERGGTPSEPGKYPAEMVVPGATKFDGAHLEKPGYRSRDGRATVAIWQSGPGILKTDGYPHEEYCLVLEGRQTITNRSGRHESFQPGDTFVIPKGWAGTWEMPTRFKKPYVAFEDAPTAAR